MRNKYLDFTTNELIKILVDYSCAHYDADMAALFFAASVRLKELSEKIEFNNKDNEVHG